MMTLNPMSFIVFVIIIHVKRLIYLKTNVFELLCCLLVIHRRDSNINDLQSSATSSNNEFSLLPFYNFVILIENCVLSTSIEI